MKHATTKITFLCTILLVGWVFNLRAQQQPKVSLAASDTWLFVGFDGDTYRPGNLYRVSDKGNIWTLVREDTYGPYSLAAEGTNIAVSFLSETYLSRDNGTIWNLIIEGQKYEKAFDKLMIKEGTIYGTNDLGTYTFSIAENKKWKKIRKLEDDYPPRYWVISGSIGVKGWKKKDVCVSSDGGTTWDSISDGLPDKIEVSQLAVQGTTAYLASTDRMLYCLPHKSKTWISAMAGYEKLVEENKKLAEEKKKLEKEKEKIKDEILAAAEKPRKEKLKYIKNYHHGAAELSYKNYPAALAHLDTALSGCPKFSEALYKRAEYYVAMNQPDKALEDRKAADRIEVIRGILNKDYYKLTCISIRANNKDDAFKYLELHMQMNANKLFWSPQEQKAFRTSVNADPELAALQSDPRWAVLMKKEWDYSPGHASLPPIGNEAYTIMDTLLQTVFKSYYVNEEDLSYYYKSDKGWYKQGESSFKYGYMENAIESFTKAIELNSNVADYYIGRAGAYAWLGKNGMIQPDIDKAIKLDPSQDCRERCYQAENPRVNITCPECNGKKMIGQESGPKTETKNGAFGTYTYTTAGGGTWCTRCNGNGFLKVHPMDPRNKK